MSRPLGQVVPFEDIPAGGGGHPRPGIHVRTHVRRLTLDPKESRRHGGHSAPSLGPVAVSFGLARSSGPVAIDVALYQRGVGEGVKRRPRPHSSCSRGARHLARGQGVANPRRGREPCAPTPRDTTAGQIRRRASRYDSNRSPARPLRCPRTGPLRRTVPLDALHLGNLELRGIYVGRRKHLECLPDALNGPARDAGTERHWDVAVRVERAKGHPGLLAFRGHVEDDGSRMLAIEGPR